MITIKEVKSKSDLRKFIKFPNRLYKNNRYYCPTLNMDERQNFNPKINPASEYCNQRLFLAFEGRKVVGRIGLIINHAYNKKKNVRQLRFTRFDVIDNFEISKLLFEEAWKYARENNLNEVIGPIGFCDLDKQGLLVEGHDEPNLFITPYNDLYYLEHLTKLGFVKDVDWLEFQVKMTEGGLEKIDRIATIVEEKYGFYIQKLSSKRGIKPIVQECFEIVNQAFENLYGTVRLTPRQINMYVNQFIVLIDLDYVYILRDKNDVVIGFGLMIPSLTRAVKKSNGKLLPLGIFRVLKALRSEKVLDMYMIAVKPEYQNMGANALIMKAAADAIRKNNIEMCETGPELEYNEKIQAQWKGFDVRQHKRRRCLKKVLD